jgi:hypothetical protein
MELESVEGDNAAMKGGKIRRGLHELGRATLLPSPLVRGTLPGLGIDRNR